MIDCKREFIFKPCMKVMERLIVDITDIKQAIIMKARSLLSLLQPITDVTGPEQEPILEHSVREKTVTQTRHNPNSDLATPASLFVPLKVHVDVVSMYDHSWIIVIVAVSRFRFQAMCEMSSGVRRCSTVSDRLHARVRV
jgi:hypothetical protein